MTAKSIRGRLLFRLLVTTVILAAVASWATYNYVEGEIVEQYDHALRERAYGLQAVIESEGADDASLGRTLTSIPSFRTGAREPEYLQLWQGDGKVMHRSPSLQGADLHRDKMPASRTRMLYDLTLPDGRPGRGAELHFGKDAGYVLVIATGSYEKDETLGNLKLGLLAEGCVMMVVTAVAVVWAVRQGLRPLDGMAEELQTIEPQSHFHRFEVDGLPAELQPIAQRLNDLMMRTEAAFARERRFSSNVAHEFRTPLAELRSICEVTIKWPPEPQQHDRNYQNMLQIVQQMSTVMETLLTLLRTPAQHPDLVMESVDLAACVEHALRPSAACVESRGLRVETNMAPSLQATTNRDLLDAMLANLIGNAAEYTPPGGRIVIDAAHHSANQVRLAIRNTNPGLSNDDLQEMGEAFWRKDTSRTERTHAGLGLSLVRRYAAVLNVRCEWKLEGEWFVVELTMTDT